MTKTPPEAALVRDDPYLYGVQFRWNEDRGEIEWRNNCPTAKLTTDWSPLTYRHRGNIGCALGWTPERLRIWADLLDAARTQPDGCNG